MREFVTADLHFGHKNIIEYEHRPYVNVEEMDNAMIELWNNTVTKDDLVYILGDFSFYDGEKTNEILKRLNGRKILIIGNHDYKFLQDKNFDRDLFEEITIYREIKRNKTIICMCHYPLAEWNRKYHGSMHLFGHIHTIDNDAQNYMTDLRLKGYRCFNVGIDVQKSIVDIKNFI